MLDAVDLGVLNMYEGLIRKLHARYTSEVWHLLYQADLRARNEQLGRTYIDLLTEHNIAIANGQTTQFDPKRPWRFGPLSKSILSGPMSFWNLQKWS